MVFIKILINIKKENSLIYFFNKKNSIYLNTKECNTTTFEIDFLNVGLTSLNKLNRIGKSIKYRLYKFFPNIYLNIFLKNFKKNYFLVKRGFFLNNFTNYNLPHTYVNYYSMLHNRFKKKLNLMVKYRRRYSYNWSKFSLKLTKWFKPRLNIFFFRKKYFRLKKKLSYKIRSIIFFKKKTSMFKKKNRLEFSFLKRLHQFRFKKSPRDRFRKSFGKKKRFTKFSKFVDLHRRTNQIWYINRNIFKNFLKFCKIRQFQLTKFLSGILKNGSRSFLNFFENSLQNMLIYSKFALSFKESKFLINNGFVYINGLKTKVETVMLSVGDVIQSSISDELFMFSRYNLHIKAKLFKRISYHMWILHRFKTNFYKQSTTRIPQWIHNILFFYEDAPSFLEIDYSIMSFCFIYERTKFNQFNFFFKKIVNLFIQRHYNWNYVT